MFNCCNNIIIPVNVCAGSVPCRQYYSTDCVKHNGTLACGNLGSNPNQTSVNSYFCAALLAFGAQNLSGTYIPDTANGANVTNIAIEECQYMRVGNVVTVSGVMAITSTVPGLSAFTISVPIAPNNFTSIIEGAGTMTTINAIAGNGYGSLAAKASTKLLNGLVENTGTGPCNYSFIFTYKIV